MQKLLLTFLVVLGCASVTVIGQSATKPAIYMASTDDGVVIGVATAALWSAGWSAAPSSIAAQTSTSVPAPATIYVAATDDGFQTYIVAAILKKKVPANVIERADLATLTLKAAQVDVQKETTGSKVVKCLFAYCADTADKASTSVQLVDSNGTIVWSYSVNKARGAKNRQSMAEAIASHLKSEYFHR
jgi:hypothetical protein